MKLEAQGRDWGMVRDEMCGSREFIWKLDDRVV